MGPIFTRLPASTERVSKVKGVKQEELGPKFATEVKNVVVCSSCSRFLDNV